MSHLLSGSGKILFFLSEQQSKINNSENNLGDSVTVSKKDKPTTKGHFFHDNPYKKRMPATS